MIIVFMFIIMLRVAVISTPITSEDFVQRQEKKKDKSGLLLAWIYRLRDLDFAMDGIIIS